MIWLLFILLLYGCASQQFVVNNNLSTIINTSLVNQTIVQADLNISEHNLSSAVAEPVLIDRTNVSSVLPDFEFKYPEEGTKLKGDVVSVSIKMRNFTIGVIGSNNSQGYGHFHVLIDNESYKEMEDASKTFRGISKGKHVLTVEMVNNDHTSYGVSHSVIIEAQTVTGKNRQ